jgi:hypothetical protein
MKSTLIIKDLSLDKELNGKAMSAVCGGNNSVRSQENTTYQSIDQNLFAGVNVGPQAYLGSGPVNFKIDSHPTQNASNYSDSSNSMGWEGFDFLRKVR